MPFTWGPDGRLGGPVTLGFHQRLQGALQEAPQTEVYIKSTAVLGHFEPYTTECVPYLPKQTKTQGRQVTWEATSGPQSASHTSDSERTQPDKGPP